MLRRGNVMKRVINIAMVLILLCVITGCKGNVSGGENGKISKNQSDKLEIVEKIEPAKISIVTFDYRDENREHYSYWIDFDNNQIQKNQTWYDIDAEDMKELGNYIVDYNVTLFSGIYWPQTKEYPDMESLFSYSILIHNSDENPDDCTTVTIDGCREYGYPDDWNIFVEKVDSYILEQYKE